jgi:hypothetical protein
MRITFHLPQALETDLREAAAEEKVSVSAFVTGAVSRALETRTKRKYGEKVLALAGRVRVSGEAHHDIEKERGANDGA